MSFGGTIKLTGENEYRSALKSIRGDMQLLSSQMKVLATDTDTSGKASQALFLFTPIPGGFAPLDEPTLSTAFQDAWAL